MKFNKLYESIFKPASDEEVKEREKQGKIEKFKEWMDDNEIRYKEDNKGNLIDVIDLEKKDKYGYTPLLITSYHNYIELAKFLISKGANVNNVNDYGDTSLHYTSYYNNIELAKLLIDKGANVNINNNTGDTPLIIASRNNYIELAKLLIDNEADVNAKYIWNYPPLYYAKSNEMKELLKSHGAKE